MRWLQFILSHSIFISFCAAALCMQTYILLHIPPNIHIIGLVFFSTLSGYNVYWFLSKFFFSTSTSIFKFISIARSYFSVAVISAGLTFYFFLKVPYSLPYLIISIFLTALYSMPLWPIRRLAGLAQKAGFLKTTLLAFTWAYTTTVLPAIEILQREAYAIALLFASRFFFMLMLCVIFDKRDTEIDKIHSLRSMATDIPARTLRALMYVTLFCYMMAGIFVRIHFGDTSQVFAFALTGAVVWIVFEMSFKKRGYFFYYFVVDGLMLLSSVFTWGADLLNY